MDPSTLPAIKILVVDDHPSTAHTLARAISQISSRVEVSSATSGLQALESAKDASPDILITDMIMPEMTGLELIEQMQKHPSGGPSFSFLITAYEVPGLKVSARRLKVKDVIIKPVHPERICQIVNQAILEMDQARPAETSSNKLFTILIADDQPDTLLLLSRYLDREGYGYIKAADGLETLEKVRSHLPDLVLLDVNMPLKDGFEVLKEIRTDPITEHIPVIILTAARLDPSEIQSGLNMGADDYVTKPFDHRELIARIHTKLRVKQAEDVIRRQNRELKLLPEIGKELSARLNIEEITDILLKRTGETLGAMLGHIVILNPDGTYQKTHYCNDSGSSNRAVYTLPKKVLLEIANDARQGFIIEDTRNDPYWSSARNASVRSVVVVPMFGRNHLLGVLLLANEQVGYFRLEHLLLLQAIASQASIAIENAQLYEIMARERQHLAALLQSAADAILMFDAENRLSLVNPAGQKLFTEAEMSIGQQLAADPGYDSLIRGLQEARLIGSFAGEMEWHDQRVFSAVITPVKEGGCVAVLHDISRFKQLEKVKDEFIATATHDLRNPITSILGFSQLMRQAGPLNDMQTDFAIRIQAAAKTMGELVENMLNLAKMDLGLEPKQEVIELTSLLVKIADEFQPQAQAKGQSFTLGELATDIKVRGDTLQLLQALRNVVGNAIKYTPENGSITLSMEQKEGKSVVKIRDTGYGIPAASLPFIFNRFYRVRNNGHDEIEGNGLGLAIVKSIIEGHQGTIDVQSELGKGSCFTVSLPCSDREELPTAVLKQEQETA